MAKKHHPRRGSLAYKPQKRAERLYPTITPPDGAEDGQIVGFAGYKAGMTRVLRIDDEKESPTKGQEVADAVTVIEVPPLQVYGVRAYQRGAHGEQAAADVIADNVSDDVARKTSVPSGGNDAKDRVADALDELSDIRLLVHTLPREAGVGKKKPEVFELPLGGQNIEAKWEQAEELLGSQITVEDVVEEGQYVDVMSVTKGKGFQGPVKRHGVKTLGHKTEKSDRKAGNIGPWHPDHTTWKIPQPGRTGANTRTELNKRVIQVGDDPEEINPESGFKNYGVVQDRYILIKGSVPGPAKRLIMFRPAVRTTDYATNPNVTHVER